ncbi:protein-L-isoaspartate(D-aspartate) O-methyltransferase [Rhodopirellula bahusiensis]|uniref:Protein-L-isoaspartate O-methyltransferase n=1 Tax=Rhodopirellula bahusiensis TaxID=2014065 RepID=A0A2G1W3A4_9BACT|nr:protein-L-isoaspartate(D-aspartate) O-methyltransferase [Rhodopirellula bahusiensis]PHQ33503.1 protein-L-isoaspartate O-methyltransferase [Rhodopirellula bahusiensis]
MPKQRLLSKEANCSRCTWTSPSSVDGFAFRANLVCCLIFSVTPAWAQTTASGQPSLNPTPSTSDSSLAQPPHLILGQTGPSRSPMDDRYAAARRKLVETRVRTAGVTNEAVLKSIETTPRHEFVPSAVRDKAYFDMALPIGSAQTISSPFIVASMTETLDPQPTDTVLEIGTGSGYQAAVLSPLVAQVYSIEIVDELGTRAAGVLGKLGYDNVHTRIGDGFLGWPEAAPFDKIIVTCSPESVPVPLVEQLREGGSMIIPVGERYQQTLYRMTKRDGELVREPLRPTLFVPMTGTAEDARQTLPDPANPEVVNQDFSDPPGTDDPEGFVPGWYYGRQVQQIALPASDTDGAEDSGLVRFENETPGLGSHLLQGIAIDGSKVSLIRLSARLRTESVVKGPDADSWPMVAISFYDELRRDLGTFSMGPYRGTRPWREDSRLVRVPRAAREGIVRIGLFGATGTTEFDHVSIEKID